MFFYNPSTRSSVWEKPEDLEGRSDVDKLLKNTPDALQQQQQQQQSPQQPQQPQKPVVQKSLNTSKRTASDDSDSEGDDGQNKKLKTESGEFFSLLITMYRVAK